MQGRGEALCHARGRELRVGFMERFEFFSVIVDLIGVVCYNEFSPLNFHSQCDFNVRKEKRPEPFDGFRPGINRFAYTNSA